jgi:signal transduction histidine kinase
VFSFNRRLVAVTGALAVVVLGMFMLLFSWLGGRVAAGRLIITVAFVLGGSAVLFAVSAGYLARSLMRVIRPSSMPEPPPRDAAPSMPEPLPEGADGVIVLDRTFNTMSASLRETRHQLSRLVNEQSALRRVATLVACGESTTSVFTSVVTETGNVLGADLTRMLRYETDETTTVVGAWGGPDDLLPVDTRWVIRGRNVPSMVLERCSPARMDCFIGAVSPLCVYLREHGIRSGVGTPIMVDGRCWGVMTAFSTQNQLLPRDAEQRISDFTELAATAIAKSQARADLSASRARIVAATDRARRQIERDLHDGTQQRLASLVMDLRSAENSVPVGVPELRTQLSTITSGLTDALTELQETARGIHPAILAKGGFVPAARRLARGCNVPVSLEAQIEKRLPESVEVAAYYVLAEALANIVKHANATDVSVKANVHDSRLRLSVRDNGRGGADLGKGSGLIGLVDRIEALDGTLEIISPPGQGTQLMAELPINAAR